ncbi:MAG: dihydrolipoyl dehydrogenase [Euzebyales bacterium]|nr:dihydrolipoyl dehydrogenase [Euzebyales bacterium]
MVVGEVARPVDVLVIGGGPGGYTAAARAAELGKEVVLVEEAALGGVCLNVGCIPSKALITVACDLQRARAGERWGVRGTPTLDFAATQRWKSEVVDGLARGVGQLLRRVEVVSGTARFLDAHRVAVESGEQVAHFRFDDAVIATGSRPVALADLPVDGARVTDSSGALSFAEVPRTLAVVGGGYIGVELGMAYAKLGARVTIVEALDRILAGFDADLVREVERAAGKLGIDLRTRTLAKGIDGDDLVVTSGDGTETVPAERVLVAVGRQPNTDDLQLDQAGVQPGVDGRLQVDAQRRTAVANLYAVGDVTAGPALAHKAMAEGVVAAEAIVGLPAGFDQVVPLIAFTDPELASVGVTEEEARAQGQEVVVGRARFTASGRAATLSDQRGFVKLVVDAGSGVLLGVGLVGTAVTDLVGEAALAVETAARAEDLAATVHPHPTLAEILGDAARAAVRR